MNQIVHVDLWMVLIFCAMWLGGMASIWASLGLAVRMVQELRKIAEIILKEQQ